MNHTPSAPSFSSPLVPLSFKLHPLCRSRSLGLSTPQLSRLVRLDRPLALADSARAGNSVFAKIRAVALLGCAVNDALVGAAVSTLAIEGSLLDLRCGGVLLVSLLGQESDATIFGGQNANGLFPDTSACVHNCAHVAAYSKGSFVPGQRQDPHTCASTSF